MRHAQRWFWTLIIVQTTILIVLFTVLPSYWKTPPHPVVKSATKPLPEMHFPKVIPQRFNLSFQSLFKPYDIANSSLGFDKNVLNEGWELFPAQVDSEAFPFSDSGMTSLPLFMMFEDWRRPRSFFDCAAGIHVSNLSDVLIGSCFTILGRTQPFAIFSSFVPACYSGCPHCVTLWSEHFFKARQAVDKLMCLPPNGPVQVKHFKKLIPIIPSYPGDGFWFPILVEIAPILLMARIVLERDPEALILLDNFSVPIFNEMITKLKIPRSRIVLTSYAPSHSDSLWSIAPAELFSADEILLFHCPTGSLAPGFLPTILYEMSARLLRTSIPKVFINKKVVYISNDQSEDVFFDNEEELIQALRMKLKPKFEVVVFKGSRQVSIAEASQVFQSASIIAGPLGDAFGNVIFAPRTARVVGVTMTGHGTLVMRRLCQGLGLGFQGYIKKGKIGSVFGQIHTEWFVNLIASHVFNSTAPQIPPGYELSQFP